MHRNTGYIREGVPIIRHFVEVYRDAEVICILSSSCVAMIREHYLKAAIESKDNQFVADVESLLPRIFEFSELLVKKLGVEDVGATFPHKVSYHASCHSLRSLQLGDIPIRLLRQVRASISSICRGWTCAVGSAAPSQLKMRMSPPRCSPKKSATF
jgi:L-lactate dehydrogenase complex protein LldE